MSFSKVPVIDFSRLNHKATKEEELSRLKNAVFEVGFLYLTNTGAENIIAELYAVLPTLFDISDAEKEACNMKHSPAFLGYSKLGAETTAMVTDIREQFEFGTPVSREWKSVDPVYRRLEGPCRIPDVLDFRLLLDRYLSTFSSLSRTFLHRVAECLSLPPQTFDSFIGGMDRLKLVKYPPAPAGSQGVGPHKDSTGSFTFLYQDDVGGLQVLNHDGEWIDVPYIPNSIIVNIAQGFEAVTGGLCGSTTHRVIAPSQTTRYSIPFFLGVNLDLTLPELTAFVQDIVQRIPHVDDSQKRAVDVISEFLSPEYACFGDAQLRNRIVSHKDVGEHWYPDLYKKYVTNVQ